MEAFSIHGGRLGAAKAAFPSAPKPWIDLSTGVNPSPYPADFGAVDRTRLPDPAAVDALERTAAASFGLDPASVLAVAGAEAGLRLLAARLKVERVAVVEPTYSGHQRTWRAANARVTGVARDDLERAADSFDLITLVNPNNPDGGLLEPERLLRLGRRLGDRGWLVVDEAFVDTVPSASLASVLGSNWSEARIIALRSFGKFYGLPGVRLGFITGHPTVIRELRIGLGEWPLSADALAAGRQAYADLGWASAMRFNLAKDAARLDGLLRSVGFEIVGGTALFRLASAVNASLRFRRLAAAGVLTRPFSYDATWLRFGLPLPQSWPRLATTLKEALP